MWKLLKTVVEFIAELPSEPHTSARAMPQTHYLNGERAFMDELVLLIPMRSEQLEVQTIENEVDTLILTPLQNL